MEKVIKLGDKVIDFSVPLVMGILNVTQDSFYDGGKYISEARVIERIYQIMEEGADIIDVGAYSTRPGAAFVDEKEELARVSWAVELIRKYYPRAMVSVDTFRARVAEEVVACQGPVWVNDISGGTMDENMFNFIAKSGMPYILMHIQGTPQTMQKNPAYADVVEDIRIFFKERIGRLNMLGFDNIILDPGFGFGKTLEHNYELMGKMDSLMDFGYPLLVGISRKSMIYKLVGTTPGDALNGTTVLNTYALLKGAKILRVHDVKEAKEAVSIVCKLNGAS